MAKTKKQLLTEAKKKGITVPKEANVAQIKALLKSASSAQTTTVVSTATATSNESIDGTLPPLQGGVGTEPVLNNIDNPNHVRHHAHVWESEQRKIDRQNLDPTVKG